MNTESALIRRCRRVSESPWVQNVVLAVIILNAVLVGLETDADLRQRYGGPFAAANAVILSVFVVEIAIRILAHGGALGRFLRDGWNVFDVVVVGLSLVPGVGAFATVARLARVLRVARLISLSPKLRLIIGTMMRSIPSLGHVSTLLALLLYLYAVVGVNLFGAIDPEHWGSLKAALLTLFQMLTLEGWVEIQAVAVRGASWAWFYFASFIIVAVFVVVNLFIAVVLNNLDEIREEDRLAAQQQALAHPAGAGDETLDRQLAVIRTELQRLETLARRLGRPNIG